MYMELNKAKEIIIINLVHEKSIKTKGLGGS